jgi:hypothetical protein
VDRRGAHGPHGPPLGPKHPATDSKLFPVRATATDDGGVGPASGRAVPLRNLPVSVARGRVACWMLYAACCMLHLACRMSHVACSGGEMHLTPTAATCPCTAAEHLTASTRSPSLACGPCSRRSLHHVVRCAACCTPRRQCGAAHVVCYMLSVACCMLSVACCTLYVVCRMLSVACRPLHVVRCMLYVACCMLYVACCMLYVACCTLPVACCMPYR